jgi:hypothetical protein
MNEFEKELSKKAAELAKEIGSDLVRPTSKSIGENIGLLVQGAAGWLGVWGEKQKIKQELSISEFKKQICLKIENISQENLIEPKISIVGPLIEASKFYSEEIYYREMFSNLLAAACDKKNIQKIHPSFVEILKQLSPLDAKLLSMFKYNNTYPICDVQEIDEDKKITPYNQSLFDFKDKQNDFSLEEHIYLTASLDNLMRLGILIKNRNIIENNYDYNNFVSNFMYKEYDRIKSNHKNALHLLKARIELTDFGRNFISCCL